MQRQKRLLLDGFHGHWLYLAAPRRFEQCFGICAIRFVAANVWPDVLRGQQLDPKTLRLTPPSPEVRRPARFHDHLRPSGKPVEESLEWPAGHPLPFDNPPRSIRERHFENVLCQINRHRRSIHLGLLLVCGLATTFITAYSAAKEPGGVHAITAPERAL
jgi:hypothetical protein